MKRLLRGTISQSTEYQLDGFRDAPMVAVAVTPSGKYFSFVVAKTRERHRKSPDSSYALHCC